MFTILILLSNKAVYARRMERQDGFYKKLSSKIFHKEYS